ncbi:site-specific integrase [Desulfurobacterium crinifex]
MERFLQRLKDEGYSENTIQTYRRVIGYFQRFLEFYGFSEENFDQNKLQSFLSTRYRTKRSFRTAVSAIQRFLKFRNVRLDLKIEFPLSGEFREFREIGEETINNIENEVKTLRSDELKLSLLLIIHLGLAPSEISLLKVSSYGSFLGVPILEEGRVKRFVLEEKINKKLKELKGRKLPEDKLLGVSPGTVKVTFHRIMKKLGLNLKVSDFRDNYVAELLRKELPQDIVVEYSGCSLDRVAYIGRVLFLRSKADIIEANLKES